MKQLKIQIFADGRVQATTDGIKGKACLHYAGVLLQLTGARAVDSDYTDEYYEPENLLCENDFESIRTKQGGQL